MQKFSVLIVALWAGLAGCSGPAKPAKNETGTPAVKAIELRDMNDHPVDLSGFRGKVVFINVWATWCKPCIMEMPSIERARKELQGLDIEFLLASNEAKDEIQAFASKRNIALTFVQLGNLEDLQIAALPFTYILDRNGNVVYAEEGFRQWDDAKNLEMLRNIIDEKK